MVSNRNDGNDDGNLPPTQEIHTRGGIKRGGPSERGDPSRAFNIEGLERDAYYAVLKAFIVQSKSHTHARETLLSALRKELRIAEKEHRQMMETIRGDETRVLTWSHTTKNPRMRPLPLSILDSRKKPKVSHANPPPPLLKTHACGMVTSTSKRRELPTQKMQSKGKGIADAEKFNVVSEGTPRSNVGTRGGRVGGQTTRNHLKSVGPSTHESLVGRSLMIRWPEDNILYKALVLRYDSKQKVHDLAYEYGTPNETRESLDLAEMDDNDIQWLNNAIDPVLQDGKGGALHFSPKQRKVGGFRVPVEKSKGRDEGRRPFDKSLEAPSTLPSRLGRGHALVEEDNNGTQVKYPTQVAKFVKDINALEHEKDLKMLENGKCMVKDYEEMLEKALSKVTNFSIDGEGKKDGGSALGTLQYRLGKGHTLVEVDNNGTQVQYPEVDKFVKEINALEDQKNLEKLQNSKLMLKGFEEMLEKALYKITNFFLDGESKEDDDSTQDSDSSTNDDSSGDGDSSTNDDSSEGGDSSGDEGSKVNHGSDSGAKLVHVEDNGDNDDSIEID